MRSTTLSGLRHRFSPKRLSLLVLGGLLLMAGSCSSTDRPALPPTPSTSRSGAAAPVEPRLALPPVSRTQLVQLVEPADMYVAPVAGGRGDGSSPADAAAFAELDLVIEQAVPGAVIELVSDQGPYQITKPITISAGGSADAPITIRGPLEGPAPILRGDRVDPYRPGENPGPVAIRLTSGADHLVFARLQCERMGNGCFSVVGSITDLTIDSVTARNVRRFFENGKGRGPRDATIDGLTISRVEVIGFSKGAIRLGHDTHDVLIVDVVGDSQGQDGDNFAMGVHLVDSVHDVRLERVSMRNALDTLHPYWNGDGFAAERGARNLHFVETHAAGNSDAGYDLKSSVTLLENVSAEGNKRNYRFWGQEVAMIGCTGLDPLTPGGRGSQIQVQLLGAATVSIRSCRFADDDPATVVFLIESTGSLDLRDVIVEHSASGELTVLASGARLNQEGIVVSAR